MSSHGLTFFLTHTPNQSKIPRPSSQPSNSSEYNPGPLVSSLTLTVTAQSKDPDPLTGRSTTQAI